MDIPEEIAVIEKRLAERGVTVKAVCQRAKIAQTTWVRWKRGDVMPTLQKWRDANEAVTLLLSLASQAGGFNQTKGAA